MSTAKPGIERLASWAGATLATGDEPDWLAVRRERARSDARIAALPTQKSEAWRYTNIEPLLQQQFTPAGSVDAQVDPAALARLGLLPDAWRAVLVNGKFISAVSALDGLPQGVTVGSLKVFSRKNPELARRYMAAAAAEGSRLFVTLNEAGWEDGFVLHVPAGVILTRPVEIVHFTTDTVLAQSRHLVVLEAGARAQLVERYTGNAPASYCNNGVLEIVVEDGANLSHVRLQEDGPQAFHIAGVYLRQLAESQFAGVHCGLGAQWSRTDIDVTFTGEGATCELGGIFLAGEKQLTDYHVSVDHALPRCASQERFRGIVHGRGRAVFDGRVLVRKDAQKTDAQLSNNNLLLSRHGEIDTKPTLEILADDVKCSHGTTVGQLDEQMIFYLRSRGIAEAEARQLLCLGFVGEVLDAIAHPAVREHAEGLVRTGLGQGAAAAES